MVKINRQSRLEIDQSGKIEQTNKVTILAFSNGWHKSIKLRAKDKRYLQNIYREAGKPKSYVLQVFSALLYLLLEKSKLENTLIVIDKEYPGHEPLIKSYLLQLVNKRGKLKISSEDLRFELVGKNSNAHGFASHSFRTNRADFSASREDILALILLL